RNRCGITRVHSQWRSVDDQVDVCELRAHRALVPLHGLEPRNWTKHARSDKKRSQPICKRACFCRSAIDQNQTLTIFQRTLPGYGMTCASARPKDHYSQIAQIDGELAANCA